VGASYDRRSRSHLDRIVSFTSASAWLDHCAESPGEASQVDLTPRGSGAQRGTEALRNHVGGSFTAQNSFSLTTDRARGHRSRGPRARPARAVDRDHAGFFDRRVLVERVSISPGSTRQPRSFTIRRARRSGGRRSAGSTTSRRCDTAQPSVRGREQALGVQRGLDSDIRSSDPRRGVGLLRSFPAETTRPDSDDARFVVLGRAADRSRPSNSASRESRSGGDVRLGRSPAIEVAGWEAASKRRQLGRRKHLAAERRRAEGREIA
jgi:hypothetical protein